MSRTSWVLGTVMVALCLFGGRLAPAAPKTPAWASEAETPVPSNPASPVRARPAGDTRGTSRRPASGSIGDFHPRRPRSIAPSTVSGPPAGIPDAPVPAAAAAPGSYSQSPSDLALLGETPIARSQYGVNVFSYDQQLKAPSTIPTLQKLGLGLQQFPNDNTWSWTTNTFRSGAVGAVSLAHWGAILEATGAHGLFIFNYDENPTWTGGGTPADAVALIRYILQLHLPIDAIVIGSEEYGSWDYAANLNPSTSAAYYGHQAAAIAQAIHNVDPAMQVGLVMDPGTLPYDLAWNRTVLGAAGGYVNFVSVHEYLIDQNTSGAGLLARVATDITGALQNLRGQLQADLPPSGPASLPIWITEFNPCYEPGPQATRPVYGAAMVESAILWRALGAARLVLWSYDGQAHAPAPGYPVDTTPHTPYGLFALVGDGIPPELPVNTLYPSGLALSTFLQAVAGGGTLTTWETPGLVVGQVSSGAGFHVFAVNTSRYAAHVAISGHAVTVPPAGLVALRMPGPATITVPHPPAATRPGRHAPPHPVPAQPSPAARGRQTGDHPPAIGAPHRAAHTGPRSHR